MEWSAWVMAGAALGCAGAGAQDVDLNPTRPTVANSAAIQSKGVLQVEAGYDAYPERADGNMETVDTLVTYTPLARLRLDFDWAGFSHQGSGADAVNGVGTISIGGKVEMKKEDYHKGAPGVAVQYEAELPTASTAALQGYGQQAILLVNHHYLRDGVLDVMANGSVVQDCSGPRCTYGGQQSVAVSYHVTKATRLYGEVFAQNVSQSNTPAGTYVFGGFYHPFGETFGIDGGLRAGVSRGSASFGTTVGVVFGKRVSRK